MSPYEFAKRECCNFAKGRCLGVYPECFSTETMLEQQQERKRCMLAEDRRCPFFEQIILLIADQPGPKNSPGLQHTRLGARAAYWARHGVVKETQTRQCPDCNGAMGKRRRYCLKCASNRRREAYRKRRRK